MNKNIPQQNQDIEIGDVEGYYGKNEQGFSHQSLVMKAMNKSLDNGSKEMRSGWFDYKQDRHGNMFKVYNEDTRKTFAESVETCLMVMSCDIDEEAEEELKKLFEKLKDKKNEYIELEKKEWVVLNPLIKSKLFQSGKGYIEGHLNVDKIYYQYFLNSQVEIYREIFKVLTKLTKRLDFYQSEVFEA